MAVIRSQKVRSWSKAEELKREYIVLFKLIVPFPSESDDRDECPICRHAELVETGKNANK
jgi:hypothetical protein